MKLRLQPIRVFCFHQVSENFEPNVCCKPDWMALSDFKRQIQVIREAGYTFISLSEAYEHIVNDKIRFKKYAVLTCDDGLKCQAALIPWLEEQHIPMTMFITVKCLDGETCGSQMLQYFGITSKDSEKTLAKRLYLLENELMQIESPMVEIGIHGYEHTDVRQFEHADFESQVRHCKDVLQPHKRYVPFYAYPYGRHTVETDVILGQVCIVPIYADGQSNYNDEKCIHREML